MKLHTTETAHKIKAGVKLRLDPEWNKTTNNPLAKLPQENEILAVNPSVSQTGITVQVKTITGHNLLLDAGWFYQETGDE